MHIAVLIRRMLTGIIGLIAAVLLLGSMQPSHTKAASEFQATSTPCTINEPGLIPSGQTHIVEKGANSTGTGVLARKSTTSVGGGGDALTGQCGMVALSEGAEVFARFPQYFVEVGKPHALFDITVEACHSPLDDYIFRLAGPDGKFVSEQVGSHFVYNFPPDYQEGDYTLYVVSSDPTSRLGRLVTETTFRVESYEGPQLSILDPVSSADLASHLGGSDNIVDRERGIQVHYTGFPPNGQIAVGLYQVNQTSGSSFGVEQMLVDSWLLRIDAEGQTAQHLAFSSELSAGDYTLAACPAENCSLRFSLLEVEPLGPPNGIAAPPLAWQQFILPEDTSSESAEVSTEPANSSILTEKIVLDEVGIDPVDTARAFYEGIQQGAVTGNFYGAYQLLSLNRQAWRSYQDFVALYSDTMLVEVESIELLSETNSRAIVHIIVYLTDYNYRVIGYDVTYELVKERGLWRLNQADITEFH